MSNIHFVGGEKGGVGKSVVARVVAQYFIDRSIPFAAIDADTSHASLLRAYGNYTQGADFELFDSADEIVNRALGADRRVLVDMPAQASRMFERWSESADLVRYAAEMGIHLTQWHVTDGSVDSVRDLERTLQRFGDQFAYVVVKNFGRSKDFEHFDQSEARRQIEHQGGKILEFPELDGVAMQRIDRASASFWSAVNAAEGSCVFTPMQRQRTRLWLERCYQALGSLGEAL